METTRQVIRWSIPGSLLVGAVVVFRAMHWVMSDTTGGALPEGTTTAAVALGIASTVPAGFVVYQIYFTFYSFGLPVLNVVALDRGGEVLRLVPSPLREQLYEFVRPAPSADAGTAGVVVDIPSVHPATARRPLVALRGLRRLANPERLPPGSCRAERRLYQERRRRNMAIIRAWLDCHEHERGGRIKREYTTLSDIYHAQGASRFALLIAAGVDVVYSWIVAPGSGLPWPVVVTVAVGLAGAYLLNVVRRDTWYTARDTLAQSITTALSAEQNP